MNCPKCQAPIPDDARFCDKCGANVKVEEPPIQNAAPQPSFTPPQPPVMPVQEQHLSVGNWVCRWLINLIPCVGPLIYLIMLFVWAFDLKYNETSRNWAKAQLIIMIASVIISIIFVCIITAMGVSTSDYLYNYMY